MEISSTPINQDESFDSQDYTPNATPKMDYRKEAMYLNYHFTNRELLSSHLLSLRHICLFPLKKNESCLKDTPNSLLSVIYANLNTLDKYGELPSKVSAIAGDLISAYLTSKDETDMIIKSAKVLTETSESQEDKSVLVKAAVTLMDVTRHIYRYTNGANQEDLCNEDTFIKSFLCPWIENVFYGEEFGAIWASAKLASYEESAQTDDMNIYPDFDLFVIEVKPPRHSNYLLDQRKLGYELQKMLDKLVDLQIPSPMVCGIWADGEKCYAYAMDLEYNVVYRMIEIGNVILPTVLEDVTKAKFILDTLLKLKSICDCTAEKIEVTVKARKAHQKTAQKNQSPKPHWKRNAENEHIKVPKKPKA